MNMGKSFKELLVLHFLNDGVRSTFVVLLPFIAKDLSFNLASVGFLGSSQPLIASILALPAGFLGSKLGGFRFLVYLTVIYSFGALALSISPSLLFVTAAFFLGALGFGMFHTVGFSLVAKISQEKSMGKNMGNFTSIGDIGRVAIPPIAVFLVSILEWRVTMALISLIGFGAFLIILFNQPKKMQHLNNNYAENESHIDFIKEIYVLLKTRKLLLALFAGIFDSLASSPVFIFLPFLLFAKGVSITEYGVITAVFFAGSLFGKNALGRGVDKFGNLKIFVFSEILMAFVLILLTLSPINLLIIIILSFLLGLFTRGTTPVIQTMMSNVSHKMHYDKVFAISEMCIGITAVITVSLMGIIADSSGIVFVFYASAIFALLAIIPIFLLAKNRV